MNDIFVHGVDINIYTENGHLGTPDEEFRMRPARIHACTASERALPSPHSNINACVRNARRKVSRMHATDMQQSSDTIPLCVVVLRFLTCFDVSSLKTGCFSPTFVSNSKKTPRSNVALMISTISKELIKQRTSLLHHAHAEERRIR